MAKTFDKNTYLLRYLSTAPSGETEQNGIASDDHNAAIERVLEAVAQAEKEADVEEGHESGAEPANRHRKGKKRKNSGVAEVNAPKIASPKLVPSSPKLSFGSPKIGPGSPTLGPAVVPFETQSKKKKKKLI